MTDRNYDQPENTYPVVQRKLDEMRATISKLTSERDAAVQALQDERVRAQRESERRGTAITVLRSTIAAVVPPENQAPIALALELLQPRGVASA
jgi:hypothetical protein